MTTLGPDDGHLFLRTGREGLASGVGHDLTIEATHWSVEIAGTGEPAGLHVAATVELPSLRVRAGTGGAVPLTDRDRAEIEATMARQLGPGTASFTATLRATDVVVHGALTLRGKSAPLRVDIAELGGGRYRVTGRIRQSTYGLTPYRAFLGALKVRDEVEVEVELFLSDPPA